MEKKERLLDLIFLTLFAFLSLGGFSGCNNDYQGVLDLKLKHKEIQNQIAIIDSLLKEKDCDEENLPTEILEECLRLEQQKQKYQTENEDIERIIEETMNFELFREGIVLIDPEPCHPTGQCIEFKIGWGVFSFDKKSINTIIRWYDNQEALIGESGKNIDGSQIRLSDNLIFTKTNFFQGQYLGWGFVEIERIENGTSIEKLRTKIKFIK